MKSLSDSVLSNSKNADATTVAAPELVNCLRPGQNQLTVRELTKDDAYALAYRLADFCELTLN